MSKKRIQAGKKILIECRSPRKNNKENEEAFSAEILK